jgi:Protein of unknown function (DUF2939)/Protein of unknown function (DUF3426)
MTWRKASICSLIFIVICAAAYWGSLLLSLRGLEAAFRDQDVVKLEKYIDWVRIREQLRSEMRGAATAHLVNEATQKNASGGTVLGTIIAGAIAPAMIDQVINDLVSPRSLARLLNERKLIEENRISISYVGLTDIDEYTILAGKSGDAPAQAARVILQRYGITWRVVNLAFTPGHAPWEVDALGAGLDVTVTPTRTSDSIVINGDIVNSATVARHVPRLRVTLRDGNKSDLVSKVIDPPVVSLTPGATAHFKTIFDHPSITATGVDVTFAAD